jgi:hypothetical protein
VKRRRTVLRATPHPRCSICRAEIEGEGLTYRGTGEPGHPPRDVGLYCRPRCLDAAQALAALAELHALAPRRIVEQRGQIADGLLVLWRRRIGPDPRLVVAAAERATRSAATR